MRRLAPLVLAVAAFAAAGVLWIVTDRRAPQRVYDEFSSANTSKSGLSQASAYLAKRGPVAMLTRPVGREPLEANAVIFRVTKELALRFDPEDLDEKQAGPPKPKERPFLTPAEDAFVRRGGRIVLACATGLLPGAEFDKAAQAEKVFPVWRGVDKLHVPFSRGFMQLRPRMHALFSAGDYVVVARERVGDGDLIAIAVPELFQNEHIAQGHNLALLTALAGTRPVYFDEVPHGILTGDGALALMSEWNLGPFLLMLAFVALLVFLRNGKRVGPAEDDHRETRSDAVDLVRSLAALYRDVTKKDEALALYHDALTRTVAHKTGLRGDALRKRVDELTGGRRTLEAINEAFMKGERWKPSKP